MKQATNTGHSPAVMAALGRLVIQTSKPGFLRDDIRILTGLFSERLAADGLSQNGWAAANKVDASVTSKVVTGKSGNKRVVRLMLEYVMDTKPQKQENP